MEEIKEVVEEVVELKWDTNTFNKLFNMDVTPYVEAITTKNADLNYLSWATAYQLLMHQDPNADIKVLKDKDGFPMFSRGSAHIVMTEITAFGQIKSMWLPVMDYTHKAVTNPNSRQINDAIMRCLAKNVALFGIGLKLYTGDDLLQYKEVASVQEESITKEQLDQINELSKSKRVEFLQINEHCKKEFKAPLDRITKDQAVVIIRMLNNTVDPQ